MKHPIHIIRPYNLGIIAATMLVILFKYLDELNESYWYHAVLLIIPAILTAAAGYVVNDIFDIETDKINKPEGRLVGIKISISKAWLLYALINLVSILLAFMFDISKLMSKGYMFGEAIGAEHIWAYRYTWISLLIKILLFVYSWKLKGTPLFGNILVASCSSAVIACCSFLIKFETQAGIFVYFGYIIFSFIITMMRELVKDVQDVPGDESAGYKTYPVIAGIKGTKVLVYAFSFIEILMCGLYSFLAWGLDLYVSSIVMGLITLSLFYFINTISRAKEPADFGRASKFLKYVMFVGVLNIPFS